MADHSALRRGEEGTTLAEVLIVIVLLGIVGAITTTGIVRGFRAQATAVNVAETLDGTRLATQRVRDFVRGADEVCANSSDSQLVLWTDDNDDGAVANSELDIFELVVDASGADVFQRRVPAAGADEIQLIRDDIINNAVFDYGGIDPLDQPDDLTCKRGKAVTDGPARIRTVLVTFTVDDPGSTNPADGLTTSTSVRIRNSNLGEEPNTSPVAEFTWDCPDLSQTCTFDATPSADPDGTLVLWSWDFGDGAIGSGETTSHTYSIGEQEQIVTLVVVDDEGASDSVQHTVEPGLLAGNATPNAAFTFVCKGASCTFDASSTTDDDKDPNGSDLLTYDWDFGDGATGSGEVVTHTYATEGKQAVTLVVTDPSTAEDSVTESVVASSKAVRVASITRQIAEKTNTYDVTFTITLEQTNGSNPGSGITVSVDLGTSNSTGKTGAQSCSTDIVSQCTITVQNIKSDKLQGLAISQVTDTTGTGWLYDEAQDVVDEIVVDKNGNFTTFKDGDVVGNG